MNVPHLSLQISIPVSLEIFHLQSLKQSFALTNITMGYLQKTIHVENGYDEGSYTFVPVIIIGAGESGIAMGCRLKSQLQFDQFRIFDRQAGVGGERPSPSWEGYVVCNQMTYFSQAPGGSIDILEW